MIRNLFLTGLIVLFSSTASIANSEESKEFVQFVPFHTLEDVREGALLEASEKLQEGFLSLQEGFIKRELLRDENGKWADLIYWESKEDSENAALKVPQSDVCGHYFSLIEPFDPEDPSQGVFTFTKISNWE
ncbi:hypothetical protein MLD52_02315 [Puniceicoccaceae bacterium K14]|nr:hypothetical protein [Puniceicoccaceae bacterium K14]